MKESQKKRKIALSIEMCKTIEKVAKEKKVSFDEAVCFLLNRVLAPGNSGRKILNTGC